MNTAEYLPSNNLFILGAILLIAIGSFLWFMRKRSNRHPMDTPRGHEIEEARTRQTLEAREHTIERPPTR
jgi:LPXTG-motif cell wall-anchored protein